MSKNQSPEYSLYRDYRKLQRKYRRLEVLSSEFYLSVAKWAKGKTVPAPVGRSSLELAQFLVKR